MRSKQQTGVTLIELMVVLAIAAILATLAAPAFKDFIENTRLTTTMSQLTADLNLARSEAIKRNSWILVCLRNTAGSDCTAGTDWQAGWLVCFDADKNGSCDTATTTNPNPVAVRKPVNASFALTSTSSTALVFNPNGTFNPYGATGQGALTLVSGTKSRTATIAVTGNFSVSNP